LLFVGATITTPLSFAADNNKVLFDESGPYGNYYTIYNIDPVGLSIFANLLDENGFDVHRETSSPLTYDKLKLYSVVLLMAPERTYTDAEINALKQYVENGGGLFLAGDNWQPEDGDENYAYNKIARSFGVDFAFNELVVDPKNSVAIANIVIINNLTSNPINTNLSSFYYPVGTYLKNPGISNVTAYSSVNSWADQAFMTSEGISTTNLRKEINETAGLLPVYSVMEYGKGRIVFTGSVNSLANLWIYRNDGWKLGLNSVKWLAQQPISPNYNTAPLFSPTLADFEYNILAMVLFSVILIASILFMVRRDKKAARSQIIRTISNKKYIFLILLNGVFTVLGVILFLPTNIYMLDSTNPVYDPNLPYLLIPVGLIFLLISAIIIYNLVHWQRITAKYSYLNIGILLFFSGISIILGSMFQFPLIEIFSIGSIILILPSVVNLWAIRHYGPDLIVEGKEFNRLEKMSMKSFPYELHSNYSDPVYIGEGGFGRVFKAKRMDGEIVAIKIPKTFDKRSEKTFISEVSNWTQLEHLHIVKLYNYKILPIPYLEMEYCEKRVNHSKYPINEAIKIVYETGLGLNHAHSKNIIHGDIKTSNIMYNHGLYKISDWGLSKLMIDESVTLSGATPQYAAPEQISHEYGKPDERTDIYQLGTVFYELVTGKLPFEGEMAELYGSILTTIPTIPSEINDQALDVENIIMKCLSKNKEDRFKSMEEFLKELEEFYKPSTGIRDETILYDDEIPLN
jgi:hypothetical protein